MLNLKVGLTSVLHKFPKISWYFKWVRVFSKSNVKQLHNSTPCSTTPEIIWLIGEVVPTQLPLIPQSTSNIHWYSDFRSLVVVDVNLSRCTQYNFCSLWISGDLLTETEHSVQHSAFVYWPLQLCYCACRDEEQYAVLVASLQTVLDVGWHSNTNLNCFFDLPRLPTGCCCRLFQGHQVLVVKKTLYFVPVVGWLQNIPANKTMGGNHFRSGTLWVWGKIIEGRLCLLGVKMGNSNQPNVQIVLESYWLYWNQLWF